MNRTAFNFFRPVNAAKIVLNPQSIQYLYRLAQASWSNKGALSALLGMTNDVLQSNQIDASLRAPMTSFVNTVSARVHQLPNVPGERYDS